MMALSVLTSALWPAEVVSTGRAALGTASWPDAWKGTVASATRNSGSAATRQVRVIPGLLCVCTTELPPAPLLLDLRLGLQLVVLDQLAQPPLGILQRFARPLLDVVLPEVHVLHHQLVTQVPPGVDDQVRVVVGVVGEELAGLLRGLLVERQGLRVDLGRPVDGALLPFLLRL